MSILDLLYESATDEERKNICDNIETMCREQLNELHKEKAKIDKQISWYESKLDGVNLYRKRYGL